MLVQGQTILIRGQTVLDENRTMLLQGQVVLIQSRKMLVQICIIITLIITTELRIMNRNYKVHEVKGTSPQPSHYEFRLKNGTKKLCCSTFCRMLRGVPETPAPRQLRISTLKWCQKIVLILCQNVL